MQNDETGRQNPAQTWWVAADAGQGWHVIHRYLPKRRAALFVESIQAMDPHYKVKKGIEYEDPFPNPAWVAKSLAVDWHRVQDHLSDGDHLDWMPAFEEAHASRRGELVAALEPLGCGVYGCVLPTSDPDVVLKLTTDKSEASFATMLLPVAPEAARAGVVVYEDSITLATKHAGSKITALWRQAAHKVGKILDPKVTPDRIERRRLTFLIDREWSVAQVALRLLFEHRHSGRARDAALYDAARKVRPHVAEFHLGSRTEDLIEDLELIETDAGRLAAALTIFEDTCHQMASTKLETVGKALAAFLEVGVFVADIHEGNLGMVVGDDGRETWVITDPGNTIVLPGPWTR